MATFAAQFPPMFRFKRFAIDDGHSAMKVGTDAVLLGSWCSLPRSPLATALDAGCGCGLIALMVAQRAPWLRIEAVDVDPGAVADARANVHASPWARSVTVSQADVCRWQGCYDLVVGNPPFFTESLRSPQAERALSRHGHGFNALSLIRLSRGLLSPAGTVSLIAPWDLAERLLEQVELAGLHPRRIAQVMCGRRTRRVMLEASPEAGDVERELIEIGSGKFKKLTDEFYL